MTKVMSSNEDTFGSEFAHVTLKTGSYDIAGTGQVAWRLSFRFKFLMPEVLPLLPELECFDSALMTLILHVLMSLHSIQIGLSSIQPATLRSRALALAQI